ncbi:hypothetical protein EDD15DRAFT_2323067 [Pisolithus albus]|nr:hypothetical protein EDD15DRAFT_2323067 [Pisolithus albus]
MSLSSLFLLYVCFFCYSLLSPTCRDYDPARTEAGSWSYLFLAPSYSYLLLSRSPAHLYITRLEHGRSLAASR